MRLGGAEWGGGEPGNGISAGLCLAGTQEIGSTVWGQIEARGGWAAAAREWARVSIVSVHYR